MIFLFFFNLYSILYPPVSNLKSQGWCRVVPSTHVALHEKSRAQLNLVFAATLIYKKLAYVIHRKKLMLATISVALTTFSLPTCVQLKPHAEL